MRVDIIMPQLGESVVEGTVTKWLVAPGDWVERDQPVVEVATDKADSEVPSPQAGRVEAIQAPQGATVKVGQVLCTIETQGERAAAQAAPAGRAAQPAPSAAAPVHPSAPAMVSVSQPTVLQGPVVPAAGVQPIVITTAPSASSSADARDSTVTWRPPRRQAAKAPPRAAFGGLATSPAVRRLALEHGVDLNEVAGTGERGRVTRDDVLVAAGLSPDAERRPGPQPADPPPGPVPAPAAPAAAKPGAPAHAVAHKDTKPPATAMSAADDIAALANVAAGFVPPIPGVGFRSYKVPPYLPKDGDQVVPFGRIRRLTADHMVYSKHVAPHVLTVAEIDLASVMRLRQRHKDAYKAEGVSLTVLAFVCHALVRALRETPAMNARVLDDAYVMLHEVNLGVAVDTPDGLVVPNVKRADELSMRGLARAIGELALKARERTLTPDDFAGSSFSVSNPGAKGNLFGAAVIAQPNVGILRIGEIKKRPVVLESEAGDAIAVHPVMYAALSYDHRVIDGALANAFLWRVGEILGAGDFAL